MNVSHSMTSTWRRCRKKFYWHYFERWVPRVKAQGLETGTLGHKALGSWYQDYNDETAIEAARKEAADPGGEAFAMLERVLKRYFSWEKSTLGFSSSEAMDLTIKDGIELDFKIPLGLGHTLNGKIDRVFKRGDGSLWVMEHKFNKQASVQHLLLDPQCSIYIAAARRIGYNVSGVLFNCIRMTDGPTAIKEPALRDYAFRDPAGAELMLTELGVQAEEIMEFLLLPGLKQERAAYRNCTRDCSWDCEYYRACVVANEGGDPEEVLASECAQDFWPDEKLAGGSEAF